MMVQNWCLVKFVLAEVGLYLINVEALFGFRLGSFWEELILEVTYHEQDCFGTAYHIEGVLENMEIVSGVAWTTDFRQRIPEWHLWGRTTVQNWRLNLTADGGRAGNESRMAT